MDVISDQEGCSTSNPRRSSVNTSSSRSGSATDRCPQELDDYGVDFDVRPPSGTNYQVSPLEDHIKFHYITDHEDLLFCTKHYNELHLFNN